MNVIRISLKVILTGFLFFSSIGHLLAGGEAAIPEANNDDAVSYQVVCEDGGSCKVDKGTFKGWRTYHAFCHVCHAQDAVGSTFAPSLLVRLDGMTRERFDEVLMDGYTGQVGVMPAWKDNPNVAPKIGELWSYLRARSDGKLGTGRPGKIK